ncbi:SDR family NAD(P)-dependent oxidoreductase [Natronorubrum sp. FCH18a]|uniref:SDR family NAD(P)-dependent oxidoreductase n=1 Tax=Natronorubrum sp. FCH18a TaxID=3447018 RepID=UPI003F51AADF
MAICSRNQEDVTAAAEAISEVTEGEILPVECNVRNRSEMDRMVEATVNEFGRLNVLINNAIVFG